MTVGLPRILPLAGSVADVNNLDFCILSFVSFDVEVERRYAGIGVGSLIRLVVSYVHFFWLDA